MVHLTIHISRGFKFLPNAQPWEVQKQTTPFFKCETFFLSKKDKRQKHERAGSLQQTRYH